MGSLTSEDIVNGLIVLGLLVLLALFTRSSYQSWRCLNGFPWQK